MGMRNRVAPIALQLLLLMSCPAMRAMDGGPMNADWFYSEAHPFKSANQLHQNREWAQAADEYKKVLQQNVGTEYDKEMAQLNMAACLMAQRQSSRGWASFDTLLGIPKEQQVSEELIDESHPSSPKTVLVRTDKVGIGDIVHFLKAAGTLKRLTGWNITVSVPQFLKSTMADAVKAYDLNLVGAKDEQLKVDYTTHLISLLGHLEMIPAYAHPARAMLTAPERAMRVVADTVEPVLETGNNLAVVFLGEDRQATLIGGKQLPRDTKNHGRHLSSAPFLHLLQRHRQLKLIDCGGETSRIALAGGHEDQYMVIPAEHQPFDTIIALARIMSKRKEIVGFGADNGPTNVFARALDTDAQDRMALIIPNAGQYDMRMEGEGSQYRQMISNCRVYKCNSPEDQTEIVDAAYSDMTSN